MKKETEEEMTFEEFLSKGDFILEEEGDYLWDDWDKCNELVANNKNLHIYTVVQDENRLWVVEGRWLVNRFGYLFSRTYVKIESNVEY